MKSLRQEISYVRASLTASLATKFQFWEFRTPSGNKYNYWE